jgi:hypothetical protein
MRHLRRERRAFAANGDGRFGSGDACERVKQQSASVEENAVMRLECLVENREKFTGACFLRDHLRHGARLLERTTFFYARQ